MQRCDIGGIALAYLQSCGQVSDDGEEIPDADISVEVKESAVYPREIVRPNDTVLVVEDEGNGDAANPVNNARSG